MTLAVFIMWWLVAIPTTRGFIGGTLFDAPCLVALPADYGSEKARRRSRMKGAKVLSMV